jgi:thiosulfate dehydrogenase [quinone] large subunit
MLPQSAHLKTRDIELAYGLLRATLGLNIFMHGVARLLEGAGTFARALVPMFTSTPLPSWSVYDFGIAVPFIEAFLGALLLVGFRTRWVLTGGCGFLFLLTFGSSLRQDWETTALQLIYTALYTALLAGIRWNSFSVDMVLQNLLGDSSVSAGSIERSL